MTPPRVQVPPLSGRRPARRLPRLPALAALAAALLAPARADDQAPLRFGFSSDVFVEVNENDARAALRVWAQTLGREQGIPVDIDLPVLAGVDQVKDAMLRHRVDAATITALEYWSIRHAIPLSPLVLGRIEGRFTEEYLLLVHRDHPAATVADLRGRSLALQTGSRSCLAGVWLDTHLLDAGLGPPATFWGPVTRSSKLTRVVLPVFFRQLDACLVTRRGFRTMVELNPQVGRQLRVLAASEPLVPVVFAFRNDSVSPLRDRLVASIGAVGATPTGRQTLTLFQTEEMEVRPVADLDATCALLDRHARLLPTAPP